VVQPLYLRNARVWNGKEATVRPVYATDVIHSARLSDMQPVNLDGYTIFPGLINAHDHLELNHYPRTKYRPVYANARQWSADVNAHLNKSPFKELRAYPLEDRLFISGLKNLLCGATTVAHHNPPHKALFRRNFPVRVLRKYGWAHSLYLSSDEEIVRSYRSTPKDWPWFIHLAEGTDDEAKGEYRRLKALGCVGKNTVFVHGVGITPEDVMDAHTPGKPGTGLVWCPSTNLYLLGQTTRDGHWWVVHVGNMALGSDSRLTADGDLLDEMRVAATIYDCDMVIDMVTFQPANLLSLPSAGNLESGAYADILATQSTTREDSALALCRSHRADLALVVKGGVPQIGDPEVMAKFPHIQTVPATLDGRSKAIERNLALRCVRCSLNEPGLILDDDFVAEHRRPTLREQLFRRWL
jgi:amidohydrolase family protein